MMARSRFAARSTGLAADTSRVRAAGMALVLVMVGWPVFALSRPGAAAETSSKPTVPRTQHDMARIGYANQIRNGLDAYRRVGMKSPDWDDAVVKLLKTYASWASHLPSDGLPAIASQAKALIDKGCKDPMVLLCYGVALDEQGRSRDAEPYLRDAAAGLQQRGYPQIRVFNAATRIARTALQEGGGKDPEAAKYVDLSIKSYVASLSDGSMQPGEQQLYLDYLEHHWRGALAGKEFDVYKALQRTPKPDPYILKVVGGKYHIAGAWKERGTGWASEVKEEGWQGFEGHLRAARKLLTEAWQSHPEFPEAPAEMITVVGGGSDEGDSEREWFDRVVAAQVDFEDAYNSLLWFLRPRWGGSYEEMYQFGLECLNGGRFDTPAPMYYLIALFNITDDLEGKPTWWQRADTFQHVEELFDGYAKQKDRPAEIAFYDSVHAAAAYRCGHADVARKLLEALGDRVETGVFSYYAGAEVAAVRKEVKAEQPPAAAKPAGKETAETQAASRGLLYEFNVFTPDEEKCIYSNEGTWKQDQPSAVARIGDLKQRITYRFVIPTDAPGAVVYMNLRNNFAVGVAKDQGGKPGEFHEELNAITWLGRRCFSAENAHEQVVDLTPYLADNPSRTIYVAVYSSYPEGGWGAGLTRVEVAALDGDEQTRVQRVKKGVAEIVERDRGRYHLNFAPGSSKEAEYIFLNSGSFLEPGVRSLDGDQYIIYRLPLSQKYIGASARIWLQGDYLVSMAPDDNGKPGQFKKVASARDKYPAGVIESFGNMNDTYVDLGQDVIATGACYIKIADAAPDKKPYVIIQDVSIYQVDVIP